MNSCLYSTLEGESFRQLGYDSRMLFVFPISDGDDFPSCILFEICKGVGNWKRLLDREVFGILSYIDRGEYTSNHATRQPQAFDSKVNRSNVDEMEGFSMYAFIASAKLGVRRLADMWIWVAY